MDVAIPSTSRFAFSFLSFFFNKRSPFAVCIFRNNLPHSGPMCWLCKTRSKPKLNTMQCGAFPKALTFLLLLSSKMLTAYLAGLTTAEFCLSCVQDICPCRKKKTQLCKVIQPLPLVGMGLCCTLQRHKNILGNPDSHRFLAAQTPQMAVWHFRTQLMPRHFLLGRGSPCHGSSLTLVNIQPEEEGKILWLWMIQIFSYTQATRCSNPGIISR